MTIDWDRVAELKDEIGEEDFAEVAQMFVMEIEERMEQIASGTGTAADYHFLRGSAANLGLAGFAAGCSQAETRAKAGEPVDLAALAELFAASLAEMGELFDAA